MTAPIECLPHVDEHSLAVSARRGAVWGSLLWVVERSFDSKRIAQIARMLECKDIEGIGERPLIAGSVLPGFHVEVANKPGELALAGGHRFSDYALIFRLDELGGDRTLLRAETRAVFPGLSGRVYRGLVIDTRGHVLVTRRLLSATKQRAERV